MSNWNKKKYNLDQDIVDCIKVDYLVMVKDTKHTHLYLQTHWSIYI